MSTNVSKFFCRSAVISHKNKMDKYPTHNSSNRCKIVRKPEQEIGRLWVNVWNMKKW